MSNQINRSSVLHHMVLKTVADGKDLMLKPLLVCGGYNPAWILRHIRQPTGCPLFLSPVIWTGQWLFPGPCITLVSFAFSAPPCIRSSPDLLTGGLNAADVQLLLEKVAIVKCYSSKCPSCVDLRGSKRGHYSHCYH